MFEINKLSEGIDFNNLTYYYTSKYAPKYFVRFNWLYMIQGMAE